MTKSTKMNKNTENTINGDKEKIQCGLIMPISSIDGCSAEHWIEIKNIISEAVNNISELDIKVSLVSDSDDVGVIQKRIVQNIYDNDIIICDVSAKNPNVMFELGMRLAFDKPTIIIKDDKTGYSFDTNIIEHLEYPRDLRFTKIVSFKNELASKVLDTYNSYKNDSRYTTFLKHFATIKPKKLDEKEGSPQQIMMESFEELFSDLRRDIVRDISRVHERESIINRRSIPIRNIEPIIRTTLILKDVLDKGKIPIDDLNYRTAMNICDAYRYTRSAAEFSEIVEVLKNILTQDKERLLKF